MAGNDGKEREELHSRWEKAYGHVLSPDDIHEITSNLSEFFRLLQDWTSSGKKPKDKQAA
jgi:hypothetical protein